MGYSLTKETVEAFTDGVMADYCRKCREGERPSPLGILQYLIEYGYIQPATMRKKAVLVRFADVNDSDLLRKDVELRTAVQAGVSVQWVQRVLKSHQSDFRKKKYAI